MTYAYCVVPAGFTDSAAAPVGIDDGPLDVVRYDGVGMVVSVVDAAEYAPGVVEQRVGDMEWLTPRAVAHDRVVTWASDRGPVVPLPMWTIFADAEGACQALRDRSAELAGTLERVAGAREYTVRVYGRPDVIAAHAASLSPRIAELERAATSANPGQAYLLRRKLNDERKNEVRAIARSVTDETYAALRASSTDAVLDPLPTTEGEGQAVLNASFLVSSTRYDAFREALTTLVARYEPTGFRFDFTGPWPPYHFVRGR